MVHSEGYWWLGGDQERNGEEEESFERSDRSNRIQGLKYLKNNV